MRPCMKSVQGVGAAGPTEKFRITSGKVVAEKWLRKRPVGLVVQVRRLKDARECFHKIMTRSNCRVLPASMASVIARLGFGRAKHLCKYPAYVLGQAIMLSDACWKRRNKCGSTTTIKELIFWLKTNISVHEVNTYFAVVFGGKSYIYVCDYV